MNMIKVLWCRFQQCFRNFPMLLVEGSFRMWLFRHLSDHVFGVPNFGNRRSLRVIFFSKHWKLIVDFRDAANSSEKFFCFWDNCILIGIVKLSLLTTGYFWSAANVLRRCPKIWHVKKRDVSNSSDLVVINEYDKGAAMQISTVLRHFYHVACRRVLCNGAL